MKKVPITIFFLLFILLSCSKSTETPDLLIDFIKTELAKSNGEMHLEDYKGIKWDKLYVLGPYNTYENFDDNLLKYRDEIENTGIAHLEEFNVLLLFDGDKLVSLSKVPMNLVVFNGASQSKNSKNIPYSKTTSFFKYSINKYGEKWILEPK